MAVLFHQHLHKYLVVVVQNNSIRISVNQPKLIEPVWQSTASAKVCGYYYNSNQSYLLVAY